MGEAFRHVARDPIEDTNTILARERRDALGRAARRAGARRCPRALRPTRLRGRRRGSSGPLAGGSVYTDDRAPVEWLIDESIVDYAAGGD